jgi:IclR family mhp operon transcriptional activator
MPSKVNAVADSPYKSVRALSRGIEILEAAADLGWARISTLAAYTGIDRATLYRLVQTLEEKGYLIRRAEDGAVALTARVLQLSDGVHHNSLAAQVITPFLQQLTRRVLWPSDFAVLASGRITIEASSHKFSPMSVHRHLVGKTRSLLRSALGIAYLSALSREDLRNTLAVVSRLGGPDAADLRGIRDVEAYLESVHRNGYAFSEGRIERNISAIALPVRLGHKPVGAVNIVFFRSAMTPAEAAAAYLPPLREAIAGAEAVLAAQVGQQAGHRAAETGTGRGAAPVMGGGS